MDDIVENVEDSPPVLLPEILSHIFAYLPLDDRKSVRLSCRSWYDSSLPQNLIKSEKYVFRANISVEEIADLMLRSNYSLLNLEFQGVPVKELPADVWKVCGERIQTLEFYECQWNLETTRNVILYCTNLTSIVVKSIKCQEATGNLMEILCSSNVLDDLIKKGSRRSELRTFAVFNEGVQLPESVFKKVSLLFPGIKHFRTGLVFFKVPFIWCPFLNPKMEPVPLGLDLCFIPETRLESLTLNYPTEGNWMETLVQKAKQGIRLKELEAILLYQESRKDSIFDFFESQRNLEVLKFGIAEASADEDKKLFFHILDNCPNLQSFSFETTTKHKRFEPSELPRFIASTNKLKFLSVVFDIDRRTPAPAPLYPDLLPKPAQLNLTSLRWSNQNVDFGAALLQRCPFLLHLHFGGCRDATLQIIFQFLVELRTLVLSHIHLSCSDRGFTGRDVNGRQEGYSIKRLQQLKYLKLDTAGPSVTGETTQELQFPRLEFLSLYGHWFTKLAVHNEEALDHFASHLPELRVLAIRQTISHEWTMRVCQPFKKLHRMFFYGESCFHDDNEMPFAEEMLASCPHLRYICFQGVRHYMFSRNPVTEKVLRSNLHSFKFPGNVFEDECYPL